MDLVKSNGDCTTYTMKIGIVGGGTAGLIAALVLKSRFKNIEVTIIKSDKIGTIGVGEGTSEQWHSFCDFCGISFIELIKETDATFKYALKFTDWGKEDYIHFVDADLNLQYGFYNASYGYVISNNISNKEYTPNFIWKDKIATNNIPYQLNFNTFMLNNFLTKKAKLNNVDILNDEIVDVVTDASGIKSLKGTKEYIFDFYIDCSGFKRLLISKLGAVWKSYKEYLPLNEAIAFPTENEKELSVCINAIRMKSGWMWQTPTQGRQGNGYVFCNDFINADEAKKEVEQYLGKKINVFKNIKFDPGALDTPWIKNCLAIGLSSSFVEPLEASALGTVINQSFLLIHKLINYSEKEITEYNNQINKLNNNILEFIRLHYVIEKTDSNFWKYIKTSKLPNSLYYKLSKWRHKLPTQLEFDDINLLYNHRNFIVIMHALGLFNQESIQKEFYSLNETLQKMTKEHYLQYKDIQYIIKSHKETINYYGNI